MIWFADWIVPRVDLGNMRGGTVILGGDEVDTGKLSLLFSQKNLGNNLRFIIIFFVNIRDGAFDRKQHILIDPLEY